MHVLGLVPVPHHGLLHDAEPDRGERDRRQVLHAADHRGRERGEEQRRSEHGTDREADDPRPEEHGEEAEHRGDHPHRGVDVAHRDADQGGALGVVGAGAHRGTEPAAEEQREAHERERHEHHCEHVVAAEADRVDREVPVDRRRVALGWDATANQRGRSRPSPASTCARPIVATVEHQARRAGEPTDDEDLHHRAERHRRGEAGDEGDQPTRAAADHEQDRERRRCRAQVALREVEDAVGPVHQGETQREQCAQSAEQRALHDDARRWGPQHLHDEEEQSRGSTPPRGPHDSVTVQGVVQESKYGLRGP